MNETQLDLLDWPQEMAQKTEPDFEDNVAHLLRQYDRHERLGPLLLKSAELPYHLGVLLFQKVWPTCRNTFLYRDETVSLLWSFWKDADFSENLMPEEEAWFDRLPDRFRVYRGCDVSTVNGVSWTTSKEIAERYAIRSAEEFNPVPVVVSGWVWKEAVLMAMNNHGEQEILLDFNQVRDKRLTCY